MCVVHQTRVWCGGDTTLLFANVMTSSRSRRELLDITGNMNHIVLHRGRELATDITRRLLRQAQVRCDVELVPVSSDAAAESIIRDLCVFPCLEENVLCIDAAVAPRL